MSEENKKEDNKINSCAGCFFIIFLFIVFLIILICLIPEKPIEKDEQTQNLLARTLCQQEVLNKLKNPKNAEFNRQDDEVFKIENMNYTVKSSLYATNDFGAAIKTYYSCKVKIIDKNNGIVSNIILK